MEGTKEKGRKEEIEAYQDRLRLGVVAGVDVFELGQDEMHTTSGREASEQRRQEAKETNSE